MRRLGFLSRIVLFSFAAVTLLVCSEPSDVWAKDPIRLKFAVPYAGNTPVGRAQRWWISEVERRTNGEVKITYYPDETLVKPSEAFQAIRSGVIQIGSLAELYNPGSMPLWRFGELPMLTRGPYVSGLAQLETMKKTPELQEQVKKWNVKFLAPQPNLPYQLISKAEARTLGDLKGKKYRAFGLQAEFLKAVGATGIGMPLSEAYVAMETGVVDGVFNGVDWLLAHRLYEPAKYLLLCDLSNLSSFSWGINLDTWQKLSPSVQSAMLKVSDEYLEKLAAEFEKTRTEALKIFERAGVKVRTLPPDERARWVEQAKPIWDRWIAEMEAKGFPARETVTVYREALDKYEALHPGR